MKATKAKEVVEQPTEKQKQKISLRKSPISFSQIAAAGDEYPQVYGLDMHGHVFKRDHIDGGWRKLETVELIEEPEAE